MADESKPLYRVPLMEEIRALPWNGRTVVSTFSGGGGSSLGYKMAGYRVAWASEFVEAARDTYKANFPGTHVDARDIRAVRPEDVLDAIEMRPGELDLFDGSPPCASFSTAGKREKGWGKVKSYSDTKQRTDDLFFEYVRMLKGIRPKVFVAENVAGLTRGTAIGYFKLILAALKEAGYRVSARVLDAQWLGVPQTRNRVIFVGVRDDLGVDPVHPKPLAYRYSVRDAIPWIVSVNSLGAGHKSEWKSADEPSPVIMASDIEATHSRDVIARVRVPVAVIHDTSGAFSSGDVTDRPCPAITVGSSGDGGGAPNSGHYRVIEEVHAVEPESSLDGYAVGREYERLVPGQGSEKYLNPIRASETNPAPCITATGGQRGAAGPVHPNERRKFTIQELKRICSFPDDFVLMGTYEQQWERCGRAVPPLMMRAIAQTILDEVFSKVP